MATKGNGVDTRRAIITIVEQHRAIHKSELCRRLDRSWGTIGYHLRCLTQTGLIILERHDGMLWVFPARLKKWERKEARVLTEASSVDVLAVVEERPGITINELDGLLDMPVKAIRRHLSRLTDAGLLKRDGLRPQRFQVATERNLQ